MLRYCTFILCFVFFIVSSAFGIERCDLQFSNKITLRQVPVANNEVLRTRGLSGITNAGNGMLFVWPSLGHRAFWMRDTHMPLIIGFFDKKNKLFLLERMMPNTDISHHSLKPVRYALELPSGQFQRHHLALGTRLEKITCHLKPHVL